MKKNKQKHTAFENIRICLDGVETLEAFDKRICQENDVPYEPSDLTEQIAEYTINHYIPTDFTTLTKIADDIAKCWDYKLVIDGSGMLYIMD